LSVAAALIVVAGGWGVARSLQRPSVRPVAFGPEDGARAQQKIFDLMQRAPRASPVVFTEAEINAFVARHVDARDLPFDEPVIHFLGSDAVEIVGYLSLGRLMHESPARALGEWLPHSWRARTLGLTILAHVRVEADPRRVLRLEPRRLVLGRQPLPAFALRVLFEPASLRFTRIALPAEIRDVRVEPGRALIEATSSRGRTGGGA
jgi:hypothetical protein